VKSLAALLRQSGAQLPYTNSRPLEIVEVNLVPPNTREVLVKIEAAGICHSDLSVVNGTRQRPLPLIAGHESAGVVVEVGADVKTLKVGDHVTSVFLPSCGSCSDCTSGLPAFCSLGAASNSRGEMLGGGTRISIDSEAINHYNGVSCYSQYAVLDERSLIKLPDDVPFDIGALFGCALLTGIGAVRNSAHAKPGQSLGVWGLGGVGLSALMGAVISKASPIFAIDPVASKRKLAIELGADFALEPGENLRDHLPGGVSVAIECAGRADTLKSAYEATSRGGTTVTVGLPPASEMLSISALSLVSDVKTIRGSYLGSANPRVDIPEFVDFWRAGNLPVEKLLTSVSPMYKVNEAMDALQGAQVIRQIIHPN
jgi:alcohol dehydrogenase